MYWREIRWTMRKITCQCVSAVHRLRQQISLRLVRKIILRTCLPLWPKKWPTFGCTGICCRLTGDGKAATNTKPCLRRPCQTTMRLMTSQRLTSRILTNTQSACTRLFPTLQERLVLWHSIQFTCQTSYQEETSQWSSEWRWYPLYGKWIGVAECEGNWLEKFTGLLGARVFAGVWWPGSPGVWGEWHRTTTGHHTGMSSSLSRKTQFLQKKNENSHSVMARRTSATFNFPNPPQLHAGAVEQSETRLLLLKSWFEGRIRQ